MRNPYSDISSPPVLGSLVAKEINLTAIGLVQDFKMRGNR